MTAVIHYTRLIIGVGVFLIIFGVCKAVEWSVRRRPR